MSRLSKAQARRWIQDHWATFMLSADVPGPPWPPEGVEAIWRDECDRLAKRIAGRAAPSNPTGQSE